jgi:hypothetical protein
MANRIDPGEPLPDQILMPDGVKIGPGPTAFTRMPSGEWSAASARVKPAIAALVVSYCRLPPPAYDGTYGGGVNDGTALVAAHQRNRRL